MVRIWTFVLSFAVSGLTQNSSNRTLFLISGPEVLYAGTSTPLAVTVFADFSGKLTAEVAHGDTKVAQTENFQGGLTKIVTLPPFSGFFPQNSLLNLTVRGYRESSLVFTSTSSLTLNLHTVSFFIHTSSSQYKPGDTVKIRVVSLQLDNKPYKGGVNISLLDPSGRVVDRWNSTGNLGIVLKEFTLSKMSPFGQWVIKATVNEETKDKKFLVAYQDEPPFEVFVKTSSQVVVGDDIFGSVRAFYPSGQPIRGTLVLTVTSEASAFVTQTKEIYGSTPFLFSKDQLQSSPAISSNVLYIAVRVTDNSTGFTVNKTVEVHLLQNRFQLMFLNFPSSIKPSLNFSATLRISRYDGSPLTSSDLNTSAVAEVTQKTSFMNTKLTTLTLPVPKDGNVPIQFKLQDQVEMLLIQARFQSSQETLRVYNNNSSPTGSYIQIAPVKTFPAQVGSPLQLTVESTFKATMLHYVVSAKGQVLAAGTKNFSSSLALMPALSWYPEACVTVYCIRSDGGLISDTSHITITPQNHVILNWSSQRAQPGEQVSLTVDADDSRFQVAVVVMGMPNSSPQFDMELRLEQTCGLKMMTNAGLYGRIKPDGPQTEGALNTEDFWSHWIDTTEPLLWLHANVSYNWTSGEITVPDGVSSLGALALVMSENQGFSFITVKQKLTISKDFSLFFFVPPILIRGEEIVLEVNVTNYLDHDLEVIVYIAQTEAFEFVLLERREVAVINAQRLTLGSHVSASTRFPIRLLALGEMEISVNAMSAEASDKLVQKALVKPEGVKQSMSETLFLELPPDSQTNSKHISFSFPPEVVPGSQKANVVLVGDILALSIEHLNSLVQIPTGCGEQNMVHFAPSVYVLQYLDKSSDDDAEIRSKAMSYMTKGYENELSYLRDDGSFSAFGQSDSSGSVWLTAFVLRCFLQAQPYIEIDQTVLSRAMTWLLKHQGSQGEFREVGRVIYTEMQGGLDDSLEALTAYVLLAFLENDTYSTLYESNVSLALKYLENTVTSGVASNYSLCLVAYALALANSPVAVTALSELTSRADYNDDVMMWTYSSAQSSYPQPYSAQVEMASYVLLAFFMSGSFIEGIALMKWLSTQRNYLGGFGTTQDTVVALQALASYAAFSGANAIDLRFNMSSSSSSLVSLLHINATNYRVYQSQEINAEKDLPLNIYLQGRGFAIFQLNVFYNVASKNVSQNIQPVSNEEAFSLDFNLSLSDINHMMLTVCMRLKDSQPIPETGMVILDVGLLSGFSLLPGAAAEQHLIRKVEETPDGVSLYLDSVNKSEVCIKLPFVRSFNVAQVKDAVLQVYDYYEPMRKATRLYNSDVLRSLDPCFFFGETEDSCQPGITVIVSSRSSGAVYSLSYLILGATVLFLI